MRRTVVSSRGAGAVLACLIAATSCGEFTRPSPADPTPVVQALLVAGDAVQYASVTYSISPDAIPDYHGAPRPVSSDSVDLTLLAASGPISHFEPVPGRPGLFRAVAVVVPGESYRLTGVVDGRAVEAETTIPEPPVILEPADTVRSSEIERDGPLRRLPFHWHASGAGGCTVMMTDGRRIEPPQLYRDTLSTLFPTQFGLAPDTTFIEFQAYDPAAAAFFGLFDPIDPPPGNITGVLGVLGSAARTDRRVVVIWE